MGKHDGFWQFTIGQRKGLGIAHENPLYVVGFNKDNNEQGSSNPAQEYFRPHSSVNASSDFEDKMKEWMKQANDRQTSLNKRANKRSY